jgi:hypothetical protein
VNINERIKRPSKTPTMSIIPKQGEMMTRIAQTGLKNLKLNKIQDAMKTRKSNRVKIKINQKMKAMKRRHLRPEGEKSNKIMNMMTNSNL